MIVIMKMVMMLMTTVTAEYGEAVCAERKKG